MKNVTKLLTVLMMFFTLSFMVTPQVSFGADRMVQIGTYTGADAQYNLPIDGYYMSGRTQYIYLASEMSPLVAGPITKLAFQCTGNGETVNNLSIKIGTVTGTQLVGTTYNGPLTTVFTQAATYNPFIGWNTFVFQTPYIWNGTSNLVIDICFDGSSFGFNNNFCQHSPYTNGLRYLLNFGTGSCTTATGTLFPYRLNVQLTQPIVGNLTGKVRNCITNNTITGASVSCGGVGPVLTNGTGDYTLTYVPTGNQTVTATFAGMEPFTGSANIVENTTTTYNFCMLPIPGKLTGVVTNAATGLPVIGAKVVWGTYVTYSIGANPLAVPPTPAGYYEVKSYAAGATTNTLQASKEGFTNWSLAGVTLTPPNTNPPQNIALNENAAPPSQPFTAVLNGAQTAVNLNWGLPKDDMVLIFDDGIQDNFVIWATGGGANMNAMRFTPISYPTSVKGFYVNIGQAGNYTASQNAFSPVQMAVYSEVGGLPGAQLSAPTTVTPGAYGWVRANFDAAVPINSGNFFIVMIQLGSSAASPGLAVDTSVQQLRSYSKFGSTPWVPGPGNYMIRAVVNGTGGPLMLDGSSSGPEITASAVPGLQYQYAPATVTGYPGSPKVTDMGIGPDALLGYQVWILNQTQQGTPANWTSVTFTTATNAVYNGWASLTPCGGYQFAVEAQYTFNRWSLPVFSNVLGKCWTCAVTVNVKLSCDTATKANSTIKLENQDPYVTDTVYTWVTDATGSHTFTNFWKGNYKLTVSHYGYTNYLQTPIAIMGDMTLNVTLLQIKSPPTGLYVYDTDAFATWYPPVFSTTIFNEPFTNFSTNGWVPDAGSHWAINAANGNPGSCAQFQDAPYIANYSQSLTSKTLVGVHSAVLKLQYDIFLSNYGTTALNQMAVEVWDGATWHSVGNWDNSSGVNIPWTTATVNITPYAPNSGFKVRFRAYGDDSSYINWWDIDNVKILAQTDPHDPCVIGYNFYLNNILDGFTKDTFYKIPKSHVRYNSYYCADVLAIYGSGYSTTSHYCFTSHFLYPPTNIQAQAIEDAVYISWNKPVISDAVMNSTERVPATGTGPAADLATNITKGNVHYNTPGTGTVTPDAPAALVYSNGTCINSPGTGAGGADESQLQTLLGMTSYGANANQGAGYSMADDFVVPAGGGWDVNQMVFYTYQTGAPTGTCPITGCFFRVYNGPPNGGGTVIWGDLTTNRFTSGAWGNIYRVQDIDHATNRAVMKITCNITTQHFAPGTYWIEWQFAGSASYSGPWAPPIVITGNTTTGNALQWQVTAWAPVTDVGAQGEPFDFYGAGGTGGTPDGLVAYRVYRNKVIIHTVPNPDSLYYYDLHVNPGHYCYDVDAKYLLTLYGLPGQYGYSRVAPNGPACVDVAYGYPLPFFEPWDMATFTFQKWTFMNNDVTVPTSTNWSINTAIGNPIPCADFSWQPMQSPAYKLAIVSPTINASAWTCADIWADFDLKLVDRNATGDEVLDFDIFVNGNWINKAEFKNEGSYDWTLKHIDISVVKGKAFKVRFYAKGKNSADILHWYVDNIHLYGVCKAPTTLAGHQNQFTTTLTWVAPVCGKAGPTPQWIHWDSGSNSTSIGYNAAYDFQIAARWSPAQLVPLDGGSVTKINFWPSSAGVATYRARIWEGATGTSMVVDQAVASVTTDAWNTVTLATPHPIDITQDLWIGMDVNASSGWPAGCDAGPAIVGFGDMFDDGTGWVAMSQPPNNLNYNWNLAAYIEPSKKEAGATPVVLTQTRPNNPKGVTMSTSGMINTNTTTNVNTTGSGIIVPNMPMGSQLLGYNVYRTADNTTSPFSKINTSLVPGLTYQDVHPSTTEPTTSWMYYVTAVFQDSLAPGPILCEPPSDTIMITFPAVGVNELTNGTVSLYPNPATEVVNVVSSNNIKTIEVLNYVGQMIYSNRNLDQKTVQLNVTTFRAGVYFVKVTTTMGIKTTKITVTH